MGSLLLALLLGCGGAPDASAPTPVAPVAHADPPEALRCGDPPALGCFVRLPGGEVLLGAQAVTETQPGFDAHAAPTDGPPRVVDVAPFWLQTAEVAAADVARCLAAGACFPDDVATEGGLSSFGRPDAAELPAGGVSHAGAARYCAWIGGRLPTEAEWTFAARGQEGRRFPWGDVPLCPRRDAVADNARAARLDRLVGVCGGMVGRLGERLDRRTVDRISRVMLELAPEAEAAELCRSTDGQDADATVRIVRIWEEAAADRLDAPTCAYDAPARFADLVDDTPEGVRGLAGNLWEWTADAEGEGRVQKGGSWLAEDVWGWRGAAKAVLPPDARLPDVGFRCAF